MPTTSPGAATSPAELKDLGNKLYTQRKYDEAIECYSAAIGKNSSVPTYFTNRALCYLKKSQWDLVIKDCKRALDLDPNLVKAHFFMGQALQELDSMDECVACLQRASDLARENKQHFGDDIAMATRIAKRKRWNAVEEKRIAEEIELQSYLNRLLREEMERQIKTLTLGGPNIDSSMTTPTTATTTTPTTKGKKPACVLTTTRSATPSGAARTTATTTEDDVDEDDENREGTASSSVIERHSGDLPKTEEKRIVVGKSGKSAEVVVEEESRDVDDDRTDDGGGGGGGCEKSTNGIPLLDEKDKLMERNGDVEDNESEKNKPYERSILNGAGLITNDDVPVVDKDVVSHRQETESAGAKTHDVHSLTEEEIRERKKSIEAYHAKMEADLHNLFTEIDDRRKKREVPDFLCGKISFDILKDPVITPSGITYERRDIEEHIQRVGHFDPVTRVTLTQDQLVPNFALKDVVDSFVAENAWAVDF